MAANETELSFCIQALFNRMGQKDSKDGYAALLELERISDESGALYPYTERFADMSESGLYVQRVRGFRLFCKQAKWDIDGKIKRLMPRCLSLLNDPKPTAVRMALAALTEMLPYKPELGETVTEAAKNIDVFSYKDSMQGLILKDIQRIIDRAAELDGEG